MKAEATCKCHFYDCRRYIRVGDTVKYYSDWTLLKKYRGTVKPDPVSGVVVAVYIKFLLVRNTVGLIEGVNRWDLYSVNRRSVPESGSFYGFPEVASDAGDL